MNGYDIPRIIVSVLSEMGGGILVGYLFALMLKKGKTLWVPILIHSILDYLQVLA